MFTSRIRKLGIPVALALATLVTVAPTASAQKYSSKSARQSGLSVQFGSHGVSLGAHYGKRSKHSSFGISIGYGSHGGSHGYGSHGYGSKSYGSHHSYGSHRYVGHHGYGSHANPACVYIPGRYETVDEKVWVQGHSRRVWIEPEFHVWTDHHGDLQRKQIGGGLWQTVQEPGYWKTLHKRVWVPGHTQCSGGHHH